MEPINHTLARLADLAKARFCRLPLLLIGDQARSRELIKTFLKDCEPEEIAWVSNTPPDKCPNISQAKATHVIGKEFQFIVYDIESDFKPNLFAALNGTLRGGGLLFMLCPDLDRWLSTLEKNNDRFMWRFAKTLSSSKRCIKLDLSLKLNIQDIDTGAQETYPQINEQQTFAVQQIIRVVKGHRNRPLVLLADRGRGKSAALGIAASQLLTSGLKNIVITAPSLSACGIIFKHLKLNLPTASINTSGIEINQAKCRFIAPDQLIENQESIDLLIIDEASGLPSPTLTALLKKYSRIVFATTLHGYEGSGQSFAVKFFNTLDALTPGWKKQTLKQPVRWKSDDPLEALNNALFFFKSSPQASITATNDLTQTKIQAFSQKELVNNELLLSQLYALLSAAHYKTQPSDLQRILNEPGIQIFLSINNQNIVAAAFTINEGELDESMDHDIYWGQRRPKGHLIPQTLTMHLGIEKATRYRYLRIMRIAVQAEHQGKQLGSQLVKHLIKFATNNHYQAIGCTFSTSVRLIHFWRQFDFSLVRLGHHKKADSNAYAALMLKSLDVSTEETLTTAQQHFQRNFPYQLRETHNKLDYRLVASIFRHGMFSPTASLTNAEQKAIESYTQGHRQFEDNLAVIYKLTIGALASDKIQKQLTAVQLHLLVVKVLQQRTWQDAIFSLGLSGKKAAMKQLKMAIFQLDFGQKAPPYHLGLN